MNLVIYTRIVPVGSGEGWGVLKNLSGLRTLGEVGDEFVRGEWGVGKDFAL